MDLKKTNLYMPKMYEEGIARGKDKTFIIYQRANGTREEISYFDILKESDKLIRKLEECGLKKGDRVGVISTLRPYWYSLTYACLRAGYIMVCIDPGVPSSQVSKMMSQTDIRAAFTTLKTVHLPEGLENNIPVFSIDKDFPIISECKHVNFLLSDSHHFPEDTFFILFSSGTTGENRKAVLLKHETVTLAIEYGMSTDTGVHRKNPLYAINDRDLMLFPPYHIAGLLCATYDIYCNTQVILLERLTPNGLISVFNDLKPDNICTVPSMLISLRKKIVAEYSKYPFKKIVVETLLAINGFLRKNFDIKGGSLILKAINKQAFGGNLKTLRIGASPFDYESNKFFLNLGIDVSMAYGLTELGAPICGTGDGYYPGTTGRILKHTNDIDVRIVNKDETGRGEVEVLSPYRMISYLRKSDNEGCFTDDGYFKTGDLGYFDKKKCLVICGRIKESIVLRNGEKLLPEEIESKYQNMDCVKEVVAFKVPGEGGCDDFSIAIVNDRSKGIQDEAVKVRVYERAEKLPQMYRPKDVYCVKELPLSSTHKVQRFRLTEMAVNGLAEPITDASMITVDEDQTTADLRKILIEVGGSSWKTEKLTQGTLLNLDSLSYVNLFVAIQEKWDIDLFQSSTQPETFGELLDIIKNFDAVDKTNVHTKLDLSQFPLKYKIHNEAIASTLETVIKYGWKVKAYGVENIPTDEAVLFCSAHRTDIDPGFISVSIPKKILKRTCMVGKADILDSKLLKQIVLSHNFIPIDRSGNSIKTLERCKELLLEGWNVLIFPEGTSVQNNTDLFPLKEGPARLAITTNKRIIPMNIVGVAHTDKEMSDFAIPSMKGKISVYFGEPIDPTGLSVKEVNDILRKRILDLGK